MTLAAIEHPTDYLRALPGDDVRQILWRFADRYDLQMLVQSVRAVARGPVARLVAAGARNTHEWTAGQAGAASVASTNPASPACSWTRRRAASSKGRRTWRWRWWPSNWRGWTPAPPRAAWPAAWRSRPIHERGTQEQRDHYMALCAPPQPGRRPQALARRLLPDRAHPLRRRRNRHAGRQGPGQRMGGGRGAHAARGEARPLHHQHGFRQLRDRRGGIGRSAHQRHLHGDPGRKRPGNFRPRHADPQTGPPALFHARPDLRAQRSGQPHHRRLHREGRRDRPASTATAKSSRRCSAAPASRWRS